MIRTERIVANRLIRALLTRTKNIQILVVGYRSRSHQHLISIATCANQKGTFLPFPGKMPPSLSSGETCCFATGWDHTYEREKREGKNKSLSVLLVVQWSKFIKRLLLVQFAHSSSSLSVGNCCTSFLSFTTDSHACIRMCPVGRWYWLLTALRLRYVPTKTATWSFNSWGLQYIITRTLLNN